MTNTLLTLATGYVLFFFSERLFWSTLKPGDRVPDLVITWVAYSVIAYLFLSLVHCFRARSAAAVFLAGACFGWLVEGTLVGTLYGTESSAPFPLSLLVTGVSWHALISVWVGWHLLRLSLDDPRRYKTLAWSVALGLFWGTWATFLWHETPSLVATVRAFATHAVVISALLALAYGLIAETGAESFRPRPFGLCVALLGVGVFYVQQVRALGVRPLVVLPALLGMMMLVLLRSSHREPAGVGPAVPQMARTRNLLAMLLMPLVATAVYAALLRVPWWRRVPVSQVLMYGLTAPVSAVVMVWALTRSLIGRAGPCARG